MQELGSYSFNPYTENGSNFYGRDKYIGTWIADNAEDMVMFALKVILEQRPREKNLYTICDYGASYGGSSMGIIRNCIVHIKSLDPNAEVQIWYEDQPVNDFKSLFLSLHGLIPGPPPYLNDFQGVYAAAIGTSFFQQCVPSNSVDLALSFIAAHWLSKKPCNLKSSVAHMVSADETEERLFKEQAAEDWVTFLSHRAAELAPRGQAMFAFLAAGANGEYENFTKNDYNVTLLSNTWRSMQEEGIITEEEFVNTTFMCYHRQLTEIEAPLKDEDSPVYKSGLRLVSARIKAISCPSYQDWISSGHQKSLETKLLYARSYVSKLRVWCEHALLSGLSEERDVKEKQEAVDEVFKRIEEKVGKHPEQHTTTLYVAYVHLMKKPVE